MSLTRRAAVLTTNRGEASILSDSSRDVLSLSVVGRRENITNNTFFAVFRALWKLPESLEDGDCAFWNSDSFLQPFLSLGRAATPSSIEVSGYAPISSKDVSRSDINRLAARFRNGDVGERSCGDHPGRLWTGWRRVLMDADLRLDKRLGIFVSC